MLPWPYPLSFTESQMLSCSQALISPRRILVTDTVVYRWCNCSGDDGTEAGGGTIPESVACMPLQWLKCSEAAGGGGGGYRRLAAVVEVLGGSWWGWRWRPSAGCSGLKCSEAAGGGGGGYRRLAAVVEVLGGSWWGWRWRPSAGCSG